MYNRWRKRAQIYRINDMVAINRTQFVTQLKLRPKFAEPYKIIQVKRNDRYDVERVGPSVPPFRTSTSADNLKFFMWSLFSLEEANKNIFRWTQQEQKLNFENSDGLNNILSFIWSIFKKCSILTPILFSSNFCLSKHPIF